MAHVITSSKSGFIKRGGRSVRQTLWFASTLSQDTLASANSAAISFQLNAAALALRPFTVVRTRGFMQIESDQTSVQEDYSAAYGQIVVSDEAVAAGIASVPTPTSQSASDWHVYAMQSQRLFVTTDVGRLLSTNMRSEIDSKAMRKVDIGQDLIGVVEATALSAGVIVHSFQRILIKLH